MSDITHKFVDQLPPVDVIEVAARLGLSVEQARHSTRTFGEWHRMKTECGEVQVTPLDFALRMADAGMSEA